VSKSHVIHAEPVPSKSKFVLRLSCPSGCVTGYVYGRDERQVREVVAGAVWEHARRELEREAL
jgi:hypothetical protein